jgi:hypothetical protein
LEQRKKADRSFRLNQLATELDANPEQLSKWLAGIVAPVAKTRVRFQDICGIGVREWDLVVHEKTEFVTDDGEVVSFGDEPKSGDAA